MLDREDLTGRLFFPRADVARAGAWTDHQLEVGDASGPRASLHVRAHDAPGSSQVLLFHGNGEVVSDWDGAGRRFSSLGHSLVVVDYRGYGLSTGVPTMRRLFDDARPVLDFVRGLRRGPLFVMGRSLGSAAAWELAGDPSCSAAMAGLVIDSGFSDVTAFLRRRGLPPDSLEPAEREALDALAKARRCKVPTLLLHGTVDQAIHVDEARAAFDAVAAPEKTLTLLPGRGHNDLWADEAYWPALSSFLAAHAR